MQARSIGPPNQAVCPWGRGPRPGACVPSFLALRKLVLALPRQFIWTLELKEGTARYSRVPSQGGHHWGEHGVRTTGLSKMTDANIMWPFIRCSHTRPCAYIVSLSLDSSPASWRLHPVVQKGPRGTEELAPYPEGVRPVRRGWDRDPHLGGAPQSSDRPIPAGLWDGCRCLCPRRRLGSQGGCGGLGAAPGSAP